MTRMKAILVGGTLAAATALSASAVTAAPGGHGPDRAEGPRGPAHHGMRKARGEGPGWGHHRRGGPRGDFCGKRAGGRMGRKLDLIESMMDLSKEQQTALTELKDTLKAGGDALKKSCEARKEEGRPKTAIEGMDRFEKSITTRLEVTQSVKSAFEKFYTTLSDKQKKAVDDLFTRRGHRGPHGKPGRPDDRGERRDRG